MSDIPVSTAKAQMEGARFGSAISEALIQGYGGNLNYLLNSVLPVGSTIDSMLTEAQFQSFTGAGWILADGRDITGSLLAVTTGFTSAPDCRGVFRRGKNNGRSTATGNAAGELALGTFQSDQNKAHTHGTSHNLCGSNGSLDVEEGSEKYNADPTNATLTVLSSGGDEANPRNVTMNTFIRIN